jgi:diguanylate cyclase (GGDEF)-like protein/putative nucleotidyltransferase with HDIG domain
VQVPRRQSRTPWIVRASVAGLLLVLGFLSALSIIAQSHEADLSRNADAANRLSSVYQDARFWVGQEESLERKYRLEPTRAVLRLHDTAVLNLNADIQRLLRARKSSPDWAVGEHLFKLNAGYMQATDGMFEAVEAHKPALAGHFDHSVVDPVYGVMQGIIYRNAAVASQASLLQTSALRSDNASATRAIVIAFGVGVALVLGLGLLIAYFRRRLDTALLAELERLSEVALTDPLTGLRNHRAFHEELAASLHRVGRSGLPLSLIMLDLDNLKAANDTLGHQAGDDRLKALAAAIRRTQRGGDCAYRIGGDEFAVTLDGTRAWSALEFAQRLQTSLADANGALDLSVSAGISERLEFSEKDVLIREADLALLAAKRAGQDAVIYTPEMERVATTAEAKDEHHTQTLASALALAVDAKDSYTRSHSQTVSQLTALIATELGFDAAHIAQVRVAGLLHDVGKIGIPDAILNKPAKLTDDEYEQMKTHSVLGYDIVLAADMPIEANWIRHHHSRLDGHGYPDQISGEDIPIESRIIFVADSFEAMTSDQPYRKAPGRQFAIDELHRCAGTQFDPKVVEALCQRLGEFAEHAESEPEEPGADREPSIA